MPERREEGSGRLGRQAGGVQPLIQKLFEVVVAGELVDLAAFFVEPHPAAALLDVVVLDLHADDGADAGEGVAHERDERAVAEADQRAGVDGVEQRPHLLGREHRRLALLDAVLGAATACAGFVGMTWPVTSQSKSMRMAARCCLTDGLASTVPSCSM